MLYGIICSANWPSTLKIAHNNTINSDVQKRRFALLCSAFARQLWRTLGIELSMDTTSVTEHIDWSQYRTAYGPASDVPEQLRRLEGQDEELALQATHDLWCSLCHQHAYVSSAAVPALPHLLRVLDHATDRLAVEILDILVGFAVCDTDGYSSPEWIAQLHEALRAERARFSVLSASSNEEIASFASRILECFDSHSLS